MLLVLPAVPLHTQVQDRSPLPGAASSPIQCKAPQDSGWSDPRKHGLLEGGDAGAGSLQHPIVSVPGLQVLALWGDLLCGEQAPTCLAWAGAQALCVVAPQTSKGGCLGGPACSRVHGQWDPEPGRCDRVTALSMTPPPSAPTCRMIHLRGDTLQPLHHRPPPAHAWWPQACSWGHRADPTLRAWPAWQHGALSSPNFAKGPPGLQRDPQPLLSARPVWPLAPRGHATLD